MISSPAALFASVPVAVYLLKTSFTFLCGVLCLRCMHA